MRDVLALGGGSRASQIATSRCSEAPASAMVIEEDMMYEPAPLNDHHDPDGKNQVHVIDEDEISIEDDEP